MAMTVTAVVCTLACLMMATATARFILGFMIQGLTPLASLIQQHQVTGEGIRQFTGQTAPATGLVDRKLAG